MVGRLSSLLTSGSVGYAVASPNDTIVKLVELFHGFSVEHAAVVDDDGILIGVVSTKDIGRFLAQSFESQGLIEHTRIDGILNTRIEEIMSTPPLTCRPETGLLDALRVMVQHGIGFLPVVDDRGVLLDAYTELHAALIVMGDRRPAKCCSTLRVFMADPETPLIEALGVMSDYGFRRLPYRIGSDIYIAVLNDVIYSIVMGKTRELTAPLRGIGRKAVLVPIDTPLGATAELILGLPERAVLLEEKGDIAGIITERDLVYAATGSRGQGPLSLQAYH